MESRRALVAAYIVAVFTAIAVYSAAQSTPPEMGVFRTTGFQTFPQGIQNTAGRSYIGTNFTNATTTFSNTALNLNVTNGRRYTFNAVLFASTDLAADGSKLDFNGGTATATNFRATCVLNNAVGAQLTQSAATSAALNTPLNIAAFTDTNVHTYVCYGSIEPSASGTFIIRAAQNAHTTGTLTVLRGSYLWLEDTP